MDEVRYGIGNDKCGDDGDGSGEIVSLLLDFYFRYFAQYDIGTRILLNFLLSRTDMD